MSSLAIMLLLLGVAPVAAAEGYAFPSTNADNALAGYPHVQSVASGPGWITLEFVNATNSLSFHEYRLDGAVPTGGSAHPVVVGDVIYPGVCVDSRTAGPAAGCVAGATQRTYFVRSGVEVRLALGGERDWDFDWTGFAAPAITADACRGGGFANWGFANQGQCIQFTKA